MSALLTTLGASAPLVSAWMIATLVVTSWLTVVALVLHRLARGVAPSRAVWSVALFTAVALTLSQPWRRSAPAVGLPAGIRVSPTSNVARTAAPSLPERVVSAARTTAHAAEDALQNSTTMVSRAVQRAPQPIKIAVVLAWPLATLLLLGIGAWTYRRQRRQLSSARRVDVAGHTVYVSDKSGPAVYGVRAPRIVVPAWLLQRTSHEQQLVLSHEQAHITAGDPALLMSACMVTALVPWNPFVWYLLNRLRLAIELDCDARVLSSGATARHYGALLIDLSAAATRAPLLTGATAFSHHASHLERRLRRMTDRPVTHTTARRVGSLTLGALTLLGACGTELPTSAELQGLDVAGAEKRAAAVAPNLTAASYEVDGKTVTEAQAKAIAAGRIASIEIQKQDKKRSFVRIKTQDGGTFAAVADSTVSAKGILVAVRTDSTAPNKRAFVVSDSIRVTPGRVPSEVLILVDGVKATEAAMKMSPDRIERIEVIKGAAAEKLYGPEGAKGAIIITTKK